MNVYIKRIFKDKKIEDIEIIKTRIIDKIRKDIIDEKNEINYKLIKIIDYIEDIKTLKLIEEIMEGGKA